MNIEDNELLERWRSGDIQAGSELFARHRARLARFFCNKIAGDTDDMIQETFLACTESCERFAGRSSFKTYLLGVARHVLLNHYRKRNTGRIDFGLQSVADLSPTASVFRSQLERQHTLVAALREMPLELQIVLELHYWEELSGPEIAQATGVPLDTAYSRLRRAKSLLKERLAVPRDSSSRSSHDLHVWSERVRNEAHDARSSSAPGA